MAQLSRGCEMNPHLLLDYGAMTLAAAVPLAAAAAAPSPVLLRSGSGSYALWATAHFLIHLRYRSRFASFASTATRTRRSDSGNWASGSSRRSCVGGNCMIVRRSH